MIQWIKRLFKKDDRRRNPKTMYDFFMKFYNSEKEFTNMRSFILEKGDCTDKYGIEPSKKICHRYFLNGDRSNLLAWYLLEKYFEGKIKIEE